MADFAFIVGASANYLPGLKALLRSIEMHAPEVNVLLINHGLPEDWVEAAETENPRLIVEKSEEPDQVRGTAIERFRVAAQYGRDYYAVCLLDADMFLTGPVDLFFDFAAAGFIVAGSNGMMIDFDRAYQEQYQCFLGVDHYPYAQTHTTVPLFLGQNDLDWPRALYASRRVDSWDDFLYLNLLGIKLGKPGHMLVMPPYTFTGIHHWQVKPETSLREKGDLLLSGTEEQVYMVHGKWWEENYRRGMWQVMEPYLDNEEMGETSRQRTRAAIDLCYRKFLELDPEAATEAASAGLSV